MTAARFVPRPRSWRRRWSGGVVIVHREFSSAKRPGRARLKFRVPIVYRKSCAPRGWVVFLETPPGCRRVGERRGDGVRADANRAICYRRAEASPVPSVSAVRPVYVTNKRVPREAVKICFGFFFPFVEYFPENFPKVSWHAKRSIRHANHLHCTGTPGE